MTAVVRTTPRNSSGRTAQARRRWGHRLRTFLALRDHFFAFWEVAAKHKDMWTPTTELIDLWRTYLQLREVEFIEDDLMSYAARFKDWYFIELRGAR